MNIDEITTACLDLETTGLDPDYDRIVEIAIVKTYSDGRTETFHSLVNPQVHIPNETSAIHGIHDEHVQDAPTFQDIAQEVHDVLSDTDLCCAFSYGFDATRLANALRRAGLSVPVAVVSPWLDVLGVLRNPESEPYLTQPDGNPIKNLKLGTLCAHFGIEGGRAHSALDDTVALSNLLKKLIGNAVPRNVGTALLVQRGAIGSYEDADPFTEEDA